MRKLDRVTEEEVIARLNIGDKVTIRYSELDSKRDFLLNGVYEGPAFKNGRVVRGNDKEYYRFIHRLIRGESPIVSVALGVWDLSLDLIANIIDTDPVQEEFNANKIIYTPDYKGWAKRNEMLRRFEL